jgi:hypothetical protein
MTLFDIFAGNDALSLLRYGQILEGNENISLGLNEGLVCYRQAVQRGSIDAFRRMFHCLHELTEQHLDAILMVHDIAMAKIVARTIGPRDPRVDPVLFVLRGLNARHLESFSRSAVVLHRWPSQSLVGSLTRLAQTSVANPRIKEKLKTSTGEDQEVSVCEMST